MPLHPTTPRNLFLTHVLIRDAFYGVGNLGWVYLYLAGVPLIQLILGLIVFRIFESFIAMPIAFRIVPRLGDKASIALSLAFQASFIFLFPFAVASIGFFVLTLVVLAIFDVLYWPVRDNIERTVSGGTLASRVGLSRALSVLAQAGGLILGGLGISLAGDNAFYIASVGILLSMLPLLMLRVPVGVRPTRSFFATMALRASPSISRIQSTLATGIIIFSACIKELVDLILPLALAYFAIQIEEIGIVLAVFILAGFASNVLIGHVEPSRRRGYFLATGLATLAAFAALPWTPLSMLPATVAILGLVSGPWLAIMDIVMQGFVRHAFSRDAGGFFIEFVDDAARILPLGALLCAPLLAGPIVFLGFLASIGTACSAAAIAIGMLGKRRLDW